MSTKFSSRPLNGVALELWPSVHVRVVRGRILLAASDLARLSDIDAALNEHIRGMQLHLAIESVHLQVESYRAVKEGTAAINSKVAVLGGPEVGLTHVASTQHWTSCLPDHLPASLPFSFGSAGPLHVGVGWPPPAHPPSVLMLRPLSPLHSGCVHMRPTTTPRACETWEVRPGKSFRPLLLTLSMMDYHGRRSPKTLQRYRIWRPCCG